MPRMDGTGPSGNARGGRGKCGGKATSSPEDVCDRPRRHGHGGGRRCCQRREEELDAVAAHDEIAMLEESISFMQARLSFLKQSQA